MIDFHSQWFVFAIVTVNLLAGFFCWCIWFVVSNFKTSADASRWCKEYRDADGWFKACIDKLKFVLSVAACFAIVAFILLSS